eukprot:s465_g14.t1
MLSPWCPALAPWTFHDEKNPGRFSTWSTRSTQRLEQLRQQCRPGRFCFILFLQFRCRFERLATSCNSLQLHTSSFTPFDFAQRFFNFCMSPKRGPGCDPLENPVAADSQGSLPGHPRENTEIPATPRGPGCAKVSAAESCRNIVGF